MPAGKGTPDLVATLRTRELALPASFNADAWMAELPSVQRADVRRLVRAMARRLDWLAAKLKGKTPELVRQEEVVAAARRLTQPPPKREDGSGHSDTPEAPHALPDATAGQQEELEPPTVDLSPEQFRVHFGAPKPNSWDWRGSLQADEITPEKAVEQMQRLWIVVVLTIAGAIDL